MTKYQLQIDDKVRKLEHEITDAGIQALCNAHNARFVGTKTSEYYQGFSRVKKVTYILRSQ